MARYIVVASPKGGVGRTTLVAQLASRLSASATRCLAVDLDPQNALSLLLGSPSKWVGGHQATTASVAQTVGIVNEELSPQALMEYLKARRAAVAYVPFGVHNSFARKHAEKALTRASTRSCHRAARSCCSTHPQARTAGPKPRSRSPISCWCRCWRSRHVSRP